jgi:hypothetical protein
VNPHLSFWLTTLPEVPAAMIASALDYLFEHGRGAVLPDVRNRIQISRHYPPTCLKFVAPMIKRPTGF